jgi:hypothetical protein
MSASWDVYCSGHRAVPVWIPVPLSCYLAAPDFTRLPPAGPFSFPPAGPSGRGIAGHVTGAQARRGAARVQPHARAAPGSVGWVGRQGSLGAPEILQALSEPRSRVVGPNRIRRHTKHGPRARWWQAGTPSGGAVSRSFPGVQTRKSPLLVRPSMASYPAVGSLALGGALSGTTIIRS